MQNIKLNKFLAEQRWIASPSWVTRSAALYETHPSITETHRLHVSTQRHKEVHVEHLLKLQLVRQRFTEFLLSLKITTFVKSLVMLDHSAFIRYCLLSINCHLVSDVSQTASCLCQSNIRLLFKSKITEIFCSTRGAEYLLFLTDFWWAGL